MLRIFKKYEADIILLSALLLCALVLFFAFDNKNQENGTVIIEVDGNVVNTLSLSENTIYLLETEYGYNEITVKDGTVYVSDADCKGHDCIDMGKIKNAGESIVCLPHKAVIYIESD